MADERLNIQIAINSTQIASSSLPGSFTPAYRDYVLGQAGGMRAMAGLANLAAQGAYDAQVRNDEQDVILEDHENRITRIDGDYVSKTVMTTQKLASQLDITDAVLVNGVKVLGPRQTGWVASTGTADKGAFNADQTYNASPVYTQAEIQALVTGLQQARQRIKALEDMARTHGLIN